MNIIPTDDAGVALYKRLIDARINKQLAGHLYDALIAVIDRSPKGSSMQTHAEGMLPMVNLMHVEAAGELHQAIIAYQVWEGRQNK